MTKFYFYSAFGLNIKSSVDFPELICGKPNFDVLIHSVGYESLYNDKFKTHNKGFNVILCVSNDVIYLYDDEPLFRVRSGKEIIVNPVANIEHGFLRYLILGPGLGTLLRQRGYLVFHASAVNMEGRGVAFLGWGGDGKSTIAVAMNNKGYPLITDDVLMVKFNENGEFLVFPSYPRVKLWNDVVNYLTDEKKLVKKIQSKIQKYSYNIDNNFSLDPTPLEQVYILENGVKNEIVPLKSQDALIELIKSSYDINLFDKTAKSENFFQCVNLVNNIPVKRLIKRQSLSELENLIHIVESDVF